MGKCRPLFDEEIVRIHKACQTLRECAIVSFFERTGYTADEAASLLIRDVWDGQQVKRFIQARRSYMKGGYSRPSVRVHDDLRQALTEYLEERKKSGTLKPDLPLWLSRKCRRVVHGLKRETLWRELKVVADRAGVEYNVGIMSFYKTFALRMLLQNRGNFEAVQKLLGHRYLHTTYALLAEVLYVVWSGSETMSGDTGEFVADMSGIRALSAVG